MPVDHDRLSPTHRAYVKRQIDDRKSRQAPFAGLREAIGPEYDSRLEERFAAWLEGERIAGRLVDWSYHPMRFNLAPALTYEPDFGVVVRPRENAAWDLATGEVIGTADGPTRYRLVEVKGSWSQKNGRESRAKLKMAAALHPWFEWVGATNPTGNAWKFEPIGAGW